MQCPNCKTSLSCACKLTTANDGTRCCTKCVGSYNAAHPVKKKAQGVSKTLYKSDKIEVTAGPGIMPAQ